MPAYTRFAKKAVIRTVQAQQKPTFFQQLGQTINKVLSFRAKQYIGTPVSIPPPLSPAVVRKIQPAPPVQIPLLVLLGLGFVAFSFFKK